MEKFEFPIYVKGLDEDWDVLKSGKPPEQRVEDLQNGVARFGGEWRRPSYFYAYLHAARALLVDGEKAKTYDDVGLPTFYLQRHATELLLKHLLSWSYELVRDRSSHGLGSYVVSKNQKNRFKKEHKLPLLLADLKHVISALDVGPVPAELVALVGEICGYEPTETFSRYDRSDGKNGIVHHVQDEVVLPVVELQRKLEHVATVTMFQLDGPETLEKRLHDAWLDLNL